MQTVHQRFLPVFHRNVFLRLWKLKRIKLHVCLLVGLNVEMFLLRAELNGSNMLVVNKLSEK